MRLTRGYAGQALFAIGLALAACSPKADGAAAKPAAGAPTLHPVSGLPVVPLTVIYGTQRHAFRVEVARSGPDQAKGLMFRTSMGADEGMVFPMDPPRPASFWMKNTVIPLDIVFVGVDHKILNIAANATPYSEEPLPSAGKVSGVLELNGGRAAALGIGPGDRVDW
jgi:uncharacterized membrane protein (UPF0127 family)